MRAQSCSRVIMADPWTGTVVQFHPVVFMEPVSSVRILAVIVDWSPYNKRLLRSSLETTGTFTELLMPKVMGPLLHLALQVLAVAKSAFHQLQLVRRKAMTPSFRPWSGHYHPRLHTPKGRLLQCTLFRAAIEDAL